MEQFEDSMNLITNNVVEGAYFPQLPLYLIQSLQYSLTSMMEIFAIQDDKMISDKIIAVLLQLFSNITAIPIIILILFLYGRVSSFYQAKRTKYYYQPTNKLYQEMMKNSKLSQMRYRPWTFALNGHWQAFLFPGIEVTHQYLNKNKQNFKSEIFRLSDGGTVMLDWYLNPKIPSSQLSNLNNRQNNMTGNNSEYTFQKQSSAKLPQDSHHQVLKKESLISDSTASSSFNGIDDQIDEQYTRTNPVIILVPGLTGDSKNLYAISTIKEAEKHGYDVVVVNYRCQAGLKPTSPHIYHAGNSEDLREAIEWIKEMRSESMLFSVGISLGAGILANCVAKMKYDCPLKAAVAVGCHYDSELSLKHLQSYWFGLYDFILGYYCRLANMETIKLIDMLNSKSNPDRIVGDEISKIYMLTHFIQRIITKIEGIKCWQDYITESSCTHRLQDVKIPLFFLSAQDDPVFGNKCIPIDKCHENILIGVTKAGGHLGYFEGVVLPHKQWFPEPTFEFINFIHNKCKQEEQDQESSHFSNLSDLRLKRENSLRLIRRVKSKELDYLMD